MVSVGPCAGSRSFSPEKAQIEFAWSRTPFWPDVGGVGTGFVGLLGVPGGPFTSPAKAAVALAPTSAAVQSATTSNDFLCIATSPIQAQARHKGVAGANFLLEPDPKRLGDAVTVTSATLYPAMECCFLCKTAASRPKAIQTDRRLRRPRLAPETA